MQKIIIESTATVKGSKISGVALTPTTSKNGNNYLPDVIDEAKNTGVWLDNLNWEHTNEKIGPVKFTVDPATHTMYYEAINNSNRVIQEGTHKVSIEAHVDEVARTCSPKACYNTPMSLTMEGLAVTENPSVQTTTLTIIESADQLNKICEEIIIKHEEDQKPEEKKPKESISGIVNQVISDQITSLETQIELNYELLQLYDQIVQVNPNDTYASDMYWYCVYNLQWLVASYLDLLEDKNNISESVKTIKENIDKIKSKPLKEQIDKIKKEHFCLKCNGIKH